MADVVYDCGKLNLIPGIMIPSTVHCSYGDEGQVVRFTLYKGRTEFSFPYSVTAQVIGVRADGANWGPLPATIEGSVISFTLNSTMTGFAGGSICEISFVNNETRGRIGTANFAIMVEPATWAPEVVYEEDISVFRSILRTVELYLQKGEDTYTRARKILDDAKKAAEVAAVGAVPGAVREWLQANINAGAGTVDKTLKIDGAAADSKVVGDTLDGFRRDLLEVFTDQDAFNDYYSWNNDRLLTCCDAVQRELQHMRNVTTILKALHPKVCLLDTNGTPLLTTDGKYLYASI